MTLLAEMIIEKNFSYNNSSVVLCHIHIYECRIIINIAIIYPGKRVTALLCFLGIFCSLANEIMAEIPLIPCSGGKERKKGGQN